MYFAYMVQLGSSRASTVTRNMQSPVKILMPTAPVCMSDSRQRSRTVVDQAAFECSLALRARSTTYSTGSRSIPGSIPGVAEEDGREVRR